MSLKNVIYDELVRRLKDRLYGYAMYMLHNPQDAEDVTQEALLRLWTHFDEVRLPRARGWALRVTRNLCLDQLRRRRTAGRRDLTVDTEVTEAVADDRQPDPPRATDARQLHARLEEAMKRLPEKQRSVFVLREIQGLKYHEIAQALELPINSVKVYLMRARLGLREELRDYAPQS
jgi:RNA polymerase sigma-70 factor (ECF subfamily)